MLISLGKFSFSYFISNNTILQYFCLEYITNNNNKPHVILVAHYFKVKFLFK